ncbi:AAA family ATPase [Sphingobacterium sp. SGG-5]|nr:AAA family ATPase [Sphingobacterium sp. SGG-5]
MNNQFIITGGPGVGKTALLNALSSDGFRIVPEAARTIIREQMETDGDALPWKNKRLYTDKMIAASILDYNRIIDSCSHEICFFDRGIPDAVCYAEMIGYRLSNDVVEQIQSCPYNTHVFILPPWKEIYETDSERKQDWEEAQQTYIHMRNMYKRLGYEPIIVPKGSIEERKEFVQSFIAKNGELR